MNNPVRSDLENSPRVISLLCRLREVFSGHVHGVKMFGAWVNENPGEGMVGWIVYTHPPHKPSDEWKVSYPVGEFPCTEEEKTQIAGLLHDELRQLIREES
jgi:hypothetical protein